MSRLAALFSDVLIGLPGGLLILMGMLMFNAVLGLLFPTGQEILLALLSFASFVVGLLARLMRPYHGMGTAAASGGIAAILLLWLGLSPSQGIEGGLVYGPLGMLAAVGFCLLGAWIFPRLQKVKR